MNHARSVLSIAVCAAFAGLAQAGEPVKLDKADLEKALGGKSISYDGRYCIKITSGNVLRDHCRLVLKTDAGYALRDANGELMPISGLE